MSTPKSPKGRASRAAKPRHRKPAHEPRVTYVKGPYVGLSPSEAQFLHDVQSARPGDAIQIPPTIPMERIFQLIERGGASINLAEAHVGGPRPETGTANSCGSLANTPSDSPVEAALQRLQRAIIGAGGLAGAIRRKFEPVLIDFPPQPIAQGDAAAPRPVSLVRRLELMAEELEFADNHLADTLAATQL